MQKQLLESPLRTLLHAINVISSFTAVSALIRDNAYFSFVLASSAPINASASAISATSILLTWSLPTSFNGILHDYKIRYKLASDSRYGSSFTAGDRPFYIIKKLRPFTDYDFQVSSYSF